MAIHLKTGSRGEGTVIIQFLHDRVFWTIAGTSVLGGVYGVFTTLGRGSFDLADWAMNVRIASGAALFACGASAACRWFRICKLISQSPTLPIDAVQRKNSFAKEIPVIERRNAAQLSCSQTKSDSFELWISTKVDRKGVPCSVRRQHVPRHRLKLLLNEMLKDKVIE